MSVAFTLDPRACFPVGAELRVSGSPRRRAPARRGGRMMAPLRDSLNPGYMAVVRPSGARMEPMEDTEPVT